ncbi:SIR2 family protein [Pantoea sp. B566]|uniref:SIR2 family protein n=1 Tax=Pantoea sp. B566 TaxID=2974030 RepID=UPI00216533E7|nr:SIR2 family protein [Pantoea sp. B566]MCS3402522.1 SIR2 family protein [Pantoea sp. B566]
MQVASEKALMSAVARTKKPLTILLGSPISAAEGPNRLGVSTVSEIVEMIELTLKKENLYEQFEELKITNTIERYQHGFDFVKNYINQDEVNNIIKNAVLNAYDKDNESWYIPKGLDSLCEIISSQCVNITSVITTNFDPLIEEGLKKHGVTPMSKILHSDGGLEFFNENIPRSIPVIHLHGFWEGADTLHTPKQLSSKRPQLKSSLSRLLKDTTLVVIAYGGWDDIFVEALQDIAYDNSVNADVIWAFFESNEQIVERKYEKLFNGVRSIYQRGRFRPYYGIECNYFLSKLKETLIRENSNSATNSAVVLHESSNKKNAFDTVITEIKKSMAGESIDSSSVFEQMPLKRYPAHRNIRLVEQSQFADDIKTHRVASIIADWGMERNGFLYSLKENEFSPIYSKRIFNVNIEGCESIDDIDRRFKDRFGHSLHTFVVIASEWNDIVILFEDVTSLDKQHIFNNYLKLINLLLDFIPNVLIINSGDASLAKLEFPIIALKPLSEPDVKSYIMEHPDGEKEFLAQSYFDSIVRLSSGLPTRLNNIMRQLKVVGIESLLEDEYNQKIDLDEFKDDDPIPPHLKESLLSFITKKNSTRHYELLKILSILQYGDTYSRLKRFNGNSPFSISDFLDISACGLTTTSEKIIVLSEKGLKEKEPVHVINPLVGIYIRQGIENDEYHSIVRKYLDLTFGDMWISGDIKFNQSSLRYLQDVSKSGPGNAHILISAYLRHAVEKDMRREIKATFNLALAFFQFLENNERYKDLIFSATEIKALMKDSSEIIQLGRLHYSLAKGLRMLSYKKESVDEMLLALKQPSLFKDQEIAFCKLQIALAYDNMTGYEAEATTYAEEVKKSSATNSSTFVHAELILAKNSSDVSRIQQLKKVLRKSERYGFKVVKSQAAILISRYQDDHEENDKLLNSALMNLNDTYSTYNVIVERNISYLDRNMVDCIKDADINILCIAYSYFYSQRIDILLQKTHRILWAVFVDRKDNESLIKLFRYSSFVWRLKNDHESEQKYADLLNVIEMKLNDDYLNDLIKYARVRIKVLRNTIQENLIE